MNHISTSHRSVTAQPIMMKLQTYNYTAGRPPHAKRYFDRRCGWSGRIPSLSL